MMSFAFLTGLWDNILAGVMILLIGWFWGRWRTMRIWKSKQFKDRVVLSLNTLQKQGEKYALTLRTLFEKDLFDVLQNHSMVKIVQNAIEETTAQNPILKLPKEDAWYVLNAVLNKIAEQSAEGILRRDMGMNVVTQRYIFCLTFEKEGGLRMQKVRIMMMQKEHLVNFPDAGEILLESSKHSTRIQTLRILKEEFKTNPHLFMEIEIYQ